MDKTMKRRGKRFIIFFFLCVLVILINFPIVYMVLNSFKSLDEIMAGNTFWPKAPTLDNYRHILGSTMIPQYILNSFRISVCSTALIVIISSMAGYAMARHVTKATRTYGKILLLLQVFPLVLALIPLFILFSKLNLVDTQIAMIILYTAIGIPYSTQMFMAYFQSVPREIEESAAVDGSSRGRTFVQIVLPLVAPGIAAVAMYDFLVCWNEYMLGSIFLKSINSRTLTVGISSFVSEFSSAWHYLFASAVLAMLPVFLLFVFFQKYMVAGLTSGSVK